MDRAESEAVLGSSAARTVRPPKSPGRGEEITGRHRPLRLLVAEDEGIAALYLEQVLTDLGHDVLDVVASGTAAVEAAGKLFPDLILMDINLASGTDGIQAAMTVRARHGIPSVFVTAHGDADTRERVRGASPLGLLTKPYSPKQIRDAVDGAAEYLRGSRG